VFFIQSFKQAETVVSGENGDRCLLTIYPAKMKSDSLCFSLRDLNQNLMVKFF